MSFPSRIELVPAPSGARARHVAAITEQATTAPPARHLAVCMHCAGWGIIVNVFVLGTGGVLSVATLLVFVLCSSCIIQSNPRSRYSCYGALPLVGAGYLHLQSPPRTIPCKRRSGSGHVPTERHRIHDLLESGTLYQHHKHHKHRIPSNLFKPGKHRKHRMHCKACKH